MISLRNYNIGKNVNFTFSGKIFTFLFLILSYLTYNGVYPLCKSLENIYNLDKRWNTKFNRLLARHERFRELERTRLREKLPDRRSYTENRNISDNIKTFSHVKRNDSNNIDLYMKNYKRRYDKKKGLSKLDCYYENKLFRKINHICDIAEKLNNDTKRAKKFFFKKYGIGLILFVLIPVLGLIFPILFGIDRKMKGALGLCNDNHFDEKKKHKITDGFKNCPTSWIEKKSNLIENFECANFIFTIIMVSIVILFIIYILIKVIKYEKIKAGKGKMNRSEYIDFCKKNETGKSLENGRTIDKSLDVRAYRLLAKYSDKSEFQGTRIQNKANDDRYSHKLRNEKGNNNTYEHLKHDKLNNVDIYLKSYRSRYAKKKGLKKFDCYYEKKIFNSINKIEKMVEHKKLSKKHLKKFLYKKYVVPFIIISLIPLLGIIIPIMIYMETHFDNAENCVELFKKKQPSGSEYVSLNAKIHTNCNVLSIDCERINNFFFIFLAIAIVSFIIYTYIKIQKYRIIKAGMLK